jgi:hypothetical protein
MSTPCDLTDRDLFAAATRVSIGDGRQAIFWESNWIGDSPLRLQFNDLYKHSRRKRRTVAEALDGNKWVDDLRHDLSTPIYLQFRKIWSLVQSRTPTLQNNTADSIRWILTADGSYSSKSAYALQFDGRILSPIDKEVWKSWAPPNQKFFAWLLWQNRLWCADRLQHRGWPNEYFCPLCRRNLETAAHLFVECPKTQELWALIAQWRNCNGFNIALSAKAQTLGCFRSAMIDATPKQHRKATSSLFILVQWSIWKERNNRIFKGKETAIPQLACFIKDAAQEWAFASAKALRKLLWEPP